MVTNITAGVIGCNMTEDFFQTSVHNQVEKFHWKKILAGGQVAGNLENKYPGTELVDNVQAIVGDQDISLVFVASNHLHQVPGVLQAGKAVRIV